MRAVWLERHGGPEVLRVVERPEPVPGPTDALIEVKACGINHLDLWVRRGGPRGYPLPLVLGSDAAGVVLKAPAASGLKAGDEVLVYPAEGCGSCPACERGDDPLCPDFKIYGAFRDGGLAERMALPARNCVRKPPQLDFITAAAVPITYITAWHMLTARALLRPGEMILIQAAGSGVSTANVRPLLRTSDICLSRVRPSIPGMRTSSRIRSKGWACASPRADVPSFTAVTW